MARTKLGTTVGGAVICLDGNVPDCPKGRLRISKKDDPLYSPDIEAATRRINAIIDELNAERAPKLELALIPDAVDEDSLRLVWRTLDPDAVPEPEKGGAPA